MKSLFTLTLAVLFTLASTTWADWEYQRNAEPLPLPADYEAPKTGEKPSRFNRKARPPFWDAATGCLVVECCEPPIKAKNGVSHFYVFMYRVSADGRTLLKTSRMWNSHKTDIAPQPDTSANTTDTPFTFSSGQTRWTFEVDTQGVITRVTKFGKSPFSHKDLPAEGVTFFPGDYIPSLRFYTP